MITFFTRFKKDYIFFEIRGDDSDDNDYLVEFIDINSDVILYSTILKVNHWSKVDTSDEKNVTIRVVCNSNIVFERNQNFKFNKVYIEIGSKALGDNIAWIPYVEEYRKKNNVDVILYTHYKFLFDNAYSSIEFTDISDPYYFIDVDFRFSIDYGPELYLYNNELKPDMWYIKNEKFDNFVDYIDYRKYSLQDLAALVLGLPLCEMKPNVNIINDNGSRVKGKYVVVAIQSTSQMKYWNNPFGWQRVFDFLGGYGYKILLIDKYKSFGIPGYYNVAPKNKYVINRTGDISLLDRIIDIKYAEMMITISSGLAWLSWAVGTPVVMISGFTKPFNEFNSNVIRIHNDNVCNGCWHDSNIKFNNSDWMFCPRKNNFICSKSITPDEVINSIKKLIK